MTQLEIKREAVRKPFNRRRKKLARFLAQMRQKSTIKTPSCCFALPQNGAKLFRHAFLLYQPRNSVNLQPPSNAHAFWH